MIGTSNNKLARHCQFYTVATILEHVIECFHTIVTDETNPYHPPLSWLTRKQMKPPTDELFHDIVKECSIAPIKSDAVFVHDDEMTQQQTSNATTTTTSSTTATATTNVTTTPSSAIANNTNGSFDAEEFSLSIRTRLEKCSIELKKSIVAKTKDGCAPLFIACKLGHFKKAKYLLETCFADIEQKGRYEAIEDHNVHSVSPLWVAAVSGHLNIVRLLINWGANINSISDTGSTPLRSACFLCKDDENYQQQSLEALQARPNNESSPNSYQIDDKYFEIVQLLVENGADILKPNYNGGTCLINSIHNYRLTKYIINHGADINASDHQFKTALHYAIQQNRLAVTRLLIQHGADPMLRANLCDDALQLSCLGGHIEIFKFLLEIINYPQERVVDAYKLIGSSILELNYDLTKVRDLWLTSLRLQQPKYNNKVGNNKQNDNIENYHCYEQQQYQVREENESKRLTRYFIQCDKRRLLAFGDNLEFSNELELQSLTADDFRIQSLLISERILGLGHRETIQRLLYRGTFYISSLRPDRCIDLWIYALKLRLHNDSILHFESIFSAQAITKLFLDLLSKCQRVNFTHIYDVLNLLVDQLEICKHQLNNKPSCCLHVDIFDLLLSIIVNLLFALNCAIEYSKEKEEYLESLKCKTVRKLANIDPRSSNGSSLLHVCLAPGVFDNDTCKFMSSSRNGNGEASPIIKLIDTILENGLRVDSTNQEGLSALQVLCVNNSRISDRKSIIKHLVEHGAHLDRRMPSKAHGEIIRQSLRDAGVNPIAHVKLSCLAARKVVESKIRYDSSTLTGNLRELIAIH